MTSPRFVFTYGSVCAFADRLRLGFYDCDVTSRFHLVLQKGDPADDDPTQAPMSIDLPKKDRAAYARAASAFNAVMDEHDASEAPKLLRRRQRREGRDHG